MWWGRSDSRYAHRVADSNPNALSNLHPCASYCHAIAAHTNAYSGTTYANTYSGATYANANTYAGATYANTYIHPDSCSYIDQHNNKLLG